MHTVARMAAVAAILAFAVSCSDKTPVQPPDTLSAPASTVGSAKTSAERTPFQQSVATTIAERQANGLAVPIDVSYTYASDAPADGTQQTPQPGEQITITATTVITFEHPNQAGNERWPDLVVEGDVPPNTNGFIRTGDYSQAVREHLARQDPDIWNRYEFGYEPRTYTFVEEYRITYPAAAAGGTPSPTYTNLDEILMGFSIPGPDIDYTVRYHYDVLGFDIVDFRAGFALDWGLGIRLPMATALTCDDPMLEGSTCWPTSRVHGIDWAADDYTQAGVPAEDGNEFVLRFELFCGVSLVVAEIPVIDLGVDESVDSSASFATPFGPGAVVEMPSIDLTVWEKGVSRAYGSIGLRATPEAGSDKLTALWAALGQDPGKISGSGNLLFSQPEVEVPHGPVLAIDGPGTAEITRNDFRYYFTNFLLDLDLFFRLNVFGIFDETFAVPITTFDLGALTGNIYLPTHSGTPGALATTVAIQNVAPTAQIDPSGTMLVNGRPAFITHAGEPVVLQGRSLDPGLDDLTLSWDWGDGHPSPDVSTTYPVPHEVVETQTHTFGDACLYNVTFKSVDDDLDFGQQVMPVVVTGAAGSLARSEGYWQHQCRGTGQVDYDAASMECFLGITDFMSAVFGEVVDISTLEQAFDVLFLQQNKGSAEEQLHRELLVAWLNFACGAFDVMEVLDTDHNGRGDTPFIEVIQAAEAVCLDPSSTEKAKQRQAQILHHIQEMGSELPSTTSLVGSQ